MKHTNFYQLLFLCICLTSFVDAQDQDYQRHWQIDPQGGISWDLSNTQNLPHSDNIEMAGTQVAGIIDYAIDTSGKLTLSRQLFFPQLHPHIKEDDPGWYVYRAYQKDKFNDDILPRIFINDKRFSPGKVKSVHIDGILTFIHHPSKSGLVLKRQLFPSTTERLFIEQWTLTNASPNDLSIRCGKMLREIQDLGADGWYYQQIESKAPEQLTLEPNAAFEVTISIKAKKEGEKYPDVDGKKLLAERRGLLNQWSNSLILETPDPVLNTLFHFSKIRASESIFESSLGLIHSPGGGRYYVGIWANDQAEYVSPLFPYMGYDIGNQSAFNCYAAFHKAINPAFKNLRYSYEVEGLTPAATLDRGDAAMIAYGALQFALAHGSMDDEQSNMLWELIEWCLEYNHRQLNAERVVASTSDEMEGRIPTGTANLSTSALYYGALNLVSGFGRTLEKDPAQLAKYENRAIDLVAAIEAYFGATVEGLPTYKYYKEHQFLRHWICMPLVVGIHNRKAATIEGLFDRLWSTNGVHVEKNTDNEKIAKIFWDRGTLYALRGTFLAGATEVSLKKLQAYSGERLLGQRVPYAVEAYPEGNMAHLSAESGLYCRIFTEGLFGIVPIDWNRFECTPRLPKDWDRMHLRNIKLFGGNIDLSVYREDGKQYLKVTDNTTGAIKMEREFSDGTTLTIE